jgi:RNA polymerase sigma factor (sigma-70 family)
MMKGQFGSVLRHIRGMRQAGDLAEAADGALLQRFVLGHDEAAFAQLVRRHGPMVLGVGRRVLGNPEDAEDVFQATFLLLARKAATIRKRDSVGSFLHGVAHRLALKARARRQSRWTHERQTPVRPTAAKPDSAAAWRELQGLLDESLRAVPAKYRAALVLCYLEGHSHEEASRRLGCSVGTFGSRLARGRKLLQRQLSRRGLGLPAGALAAVLAANTATAAVPAALCQTVARAGLAAVARQGLKMLFAVKASAAFVVLLAVGLVGGWMYQPPPAAPTQPPVAAQTSPTDSGAVKEPGKDRYGDPLPEGAIARLGTVRFRHGFITYAVAYSPDGKVLASAGGGRGLCLWDAATGKLLRELEPVSHVSGVAFSPDGKWLASAGGVGRLVLWDVAAGTEVRRMRGHDGGGVMTVAFSPDGKTIASGGHDKLVRRWDAATGAELAPLRGHDGSVLSAAYSPDGRLIAGSGLSNDVRLWDAATGEPRGVLSGHKDWVLRIAFSPDGKWLASGGQDQEVRLWDVAGRKERAVLGKALGDVNAVTFSRDGRTLATGHADGKVHLWDTASARELRSIQAHAFHTQALAFSPDGTTLASGASESTLRLWDPQTGRERHAVAAPRGGVHWLRFTPDGRSLFVAAQEGTVQRWDWTRDVLSTLLSRQPASVFDASVLTPDGPASAVYDPKLRAVRVWGPDTSREPRRLGDNLDHVWALAFSPDGRRLAGSGKDRTLRLWDVGTGRELARPVALDDQAFALAFAPDGKTLVSGHINRDRRPFRGPGLRLWDAATLGELHRFDCPKEVYHVLFSPDGRTVAASLGDLTTHMWDVATGKKVPAPRAMLNCWGLGFSADSNLVALGTKEPFSGIILVELLSGQEVRRLTGGHHSGVLNLAFSPGGTLLASAGGDSNVVLWDLTGRHLNGGKQPPLNPQKCWEDLADSDAARAYAAVWQLAAAPEQAVGLLRERLRPAVPLDEAGRRRMKQWLAELDSDTFAVRQQAFRGLEGLGDLAAPALRGAMQGRPAPGARRQIEALLGALSSWSAERLRVARAVAALEGMDTTPARRLLEELSRGAPEALSTREAKAAVGRLAERPNAR